MDPHPHVSSNAHVILVMQEQEARDAVEEAELLAPLPWASAGPGPTEQAVAPSGIQPQVGLYSAQYKCSVELPWIGTGTGTRDELATGALLAYDRYEIAVYFCIC